VSYIEYFTFVSATTLEGLKWMQELGVSP